MHRHTYTHIHELVLVLARRVTLPMAGCEQRVWRKAIVCTLRRFDNLRRHGMLMAKVNKEQMHMEQNIFRTKENEGRHGKHVQQWN
eukprot:1152913-Pelagomonas_calceolata.AAC.2